MRTFCQKLADVLEVEEVRPTDVLKDFANWDSLTVLSVIDMVNDGYGIQLDAEQLAKQRTAADLELYVTTTAVKSP